MPATIDSQTIATLRHFADGGDKVAQAIVAIFAGTYFAKDVTIGAETSEAISVAGQVVHQDGTKRPGVIGVLIKSYAPTGTGNLSITAGGSHGTAKKGSGTAELWLETEADGSFSVDVANANTEDTLLRMETDNGEVNLVKLSYT